MKIVLIIVVAIILLVGLAPFGSAVVLEKCDRCHKGKKAVERIIARAKIVTAADLNKTLKEGPKKGIHKLLTDADLKTVAAALNLK
jgi:hypothetical protein